MKRTWITVTIIVLLTLTLAGCGPKQAANHLEAIKQAKVVKVGTSADYPPFESVDSAGNKVGFDIDLMNEVAKRMGVTVEWVDMPFDSLIAAVQEGKIDMAVSAFNYSEERDQKIDFTDAYYTSEDSFMAAETFSGQFSQPEDAANFKVGVQTGTTQDAWLTDNLVGKGLAEENLFRYDRVDQAVLDLKSGRIDLLMSDYVPAQALAKQVGGMKILYHGVLSSGPVNMVVPDGDLELLAELNKTIQALKAEGFIDSLAEKYFAAQ